jgi:hypothetical protein
LDQVWIKVASGVASPCEAAGPVNPPGSPRVARLHRFPKYRAQKRSILPKVLARFWVGRTWGPHDIKAERFVAQFLNLVTHGGMTLLHCIPEYRPKIGQYLHCPPRAHLDQICAMGQSHTHLSTWVSCHVKRRLSAVAACQGIRIHPVETAGRADARIERA